MGLKLFTTFFFSDRESLWETGKVDQKDVSARVEKQSILKVLTGTG